jgi:hypothetical protein
MAGITPDPNKRDYLLPPGCKDLIDLLQPRGGGQEKIPGARAKIKMSRRGRRNGGLADIEKYLAMVFASRTLTFSLDIRPPGECLSVHVSRHNDRELDASLYVQMNTSEEKAIRDFFHRHHLPAPADSEIPAGFVPGLPVYDRFTISPVPPGAGELAGFLAELLREVCGLNEESSLRFSYHELTKVD